MTKDIIKQGFAEAEKEQQQREVNKIKEIVQKHLEKIAYHQEQAKEHGEKAKLLRKDLDDLKSGRLDRIEERQEKDEKAKEIRIIEVHRIVEQYIPLRPWISPYQVVWATPFQQLSTGITTISTTSGTTFATVSAQSNQLVLTGATCSAFASGSYSVGANTINL